jgi:hypothetical protein
VVVFDKRCMRPARHCCQRFAAEDDRQCHLTGVMACDDDLGGGGSDAAIGPNGVKSSTAKAQRTRREEFHFAVLASLR